MISPKTRKYIWERSQRHCEFQLEGCQGSAIEIDHIKSAGRGGSSKPGNLAAVCRHCHRAKTDNRPGTEIYRTHRWQPEGVDENGEQIMLKDKHGVRFHP